MSKLLKALGAISEVGDEPRTQDTAQTKAERLPKVSSRTRYVADGNVIDEQPLSFSISVDIGRLQNQGLHPGDEHLELIGQEFRRIKRPVLNNAFAAPVAGADDANVIMIASALPQTGKSFCAFNLAMSIARERDVGAVIVDADVIKPNASRAFGLEDRLGLIDYLLDSSVTLDDILVGTDLNDMVVVPSGRQHEEATELLASRRMKQLICALSERYPARAIIVDTPPLLLTNEAHALAENMGQIVMVVAAGESSQEATLEAISSFDRSKPINAILNKSTNGPNSGYSASDYGYYYAAR